jgi:hypothetical protein
VCTCAGQVRASFAVPFVVCGTTIAVLEFVLAEVLVNTYIYIYI